jgi:hypothetical protein
MPGMRHQRRACFPGRQLCGPWQPQPPEPSSKRPIIERIIGAIAIIGTVPVIGTGIIIGIDTIIGAPITVATIITTGIHIIGNDPKKYDERKAGAGGRLFDK